MRTSSIVLVAATGAGAFALEARTFEVAAWRGETVAALGRNMRTGAESASLEFRATDCEAPSGIEAVTDYRFGRHRTLAFASPFTDGAILQREMPVAVWGTADSNAEVKVSFAGRTVTAKADAALKRVYDAVNARVNATPNGHGGTFQAGWWSINLDRQMGRATAATPDGRRKGETLSRNNVATAGCGREGPTALMNSNLKLDMAESPDGHIMDVILPLSVAKSPSAAANIAGMLAAYFERGGQCLHLNCFDSQTLKDAINAALRAWISSQATTHYCFGTAAGPYPFPDLVREFQSVIGREARAQMLERTGTLPDYVVAAVGGGSNAIGMFHAFVPDEGVRIIGVEGGIRTPSVPPIAMEPVDRPSL